MQSTYTVAGYSSQIRCWHLSSCVPANGSPHHTSDTPGILARRRGQPAQAHLISTGTKRAVEGDPRLSNSKAWKAIGSSRRVPLAAVDGSCERGRHAGLKRLCWEGWPLTDTRFLCMGWEAEDGHDLHRGPSTSETRAPTFSVCLFPRVPSEPRPLVCLCAVPRLVSIPIPAPGHCGEPVLVSRECKLGRHRTCLRLALQLNQFPPGLRARQARKFNSSVQQGHRKPLNDHGWDGI